MIVAGWRGSLRRLAHPSRSFPLGPLTGRVPGSASHRGPKCSGTDQNRARLARPWIRKDVPKAVGVVSLGSLGGRPPPKHHERFPSETVRAGGGEALLVAASICHRVSP